MRQIERLSYSAFALWESRPEEFFLQRLSTNRPPRVPQERPAAAGAAFDAYVKSSLYEELKLGSNPKYTFEALFESQVEPHNRDWARVEGAYIFDCYKTSGMYTNLLCDLKVAREAPRFEFTVEAIINGVPFLGKPDARWVSPGRVKVIHDWKCNGFCAKSAVSPHKSYMLCKDGYKAEKQSKSHGTEHKEFLGYQHGDLLINTSYLEAANTEWADQLSLYGWTMGEKIGDENVVLSVHQIVAKPMPEGRPQLRVAEYRARVKSEYQFKLAERLKHCWDAVSSGHVFPDLSREDSDARCAILDEAAVGLQSDGSSKDQFFSEATRQLYRG
jgi:hypothetical protein